MQALAAICVLSWLTMLIAGYALQRARDPFPRNALRNVVQADFARERLSWKLYCLAECTTILLLICTSMPLACACLLTRNAMLASKPGRAKRKATDLGDPVFTWYCHTWPTRLRVLAP
jgi:hypothetical protein